MPVTSVQLAVAQPYDVRVSTAQTDGRRTAAAARRRAREKDIIGATRALFDERGVRDAQIEDIARAVGINRAIVYRHFTGKEELFALTLVGYLDELRESLAAAAESSTDPEQRLAAMVGAFVEYGVAHPAFVDCAQTLMRRTGPDLLDEISESALFRLGRAISSCLVLLTQVLEDHWEDPDRSAFDAALHELLEAWNGTRAHVVLVAPEVGSGVVPATRSARVFADLLGRATTALAGTSDEVVQVVAGQPRRLR